MDASSIATHGLHQADLQLDDAAARIVSTGAAASTGGNADVVDLSSAMGALLSAQGLYDANVATLKTADQMVQNLVNLIG